jgi:hypothetical protein
LNYRLDLEHWFVSLADVRTHHSLDSNYAAVLSASTLRNQLVNRFQLPLFWSTKLRKTLLRVVAERRASPLLATRRLNSTYQSVQSDILGRCGFCHVFGPCRCLPLPLPDWPQRPWRSR